jgi:beta-galactosidase
MAVVQSAKKAGSITVEATSPGLAPAKVTVQANAITLRPQVAVWERKVPVGSGLTGLWRPLPVAAASRRFEWLAGNGNILFTLSQAGSTLTGTLEGEGGYFGTEKPISIEEGKVDGNHVFFKAGSSTYSGTIQGDQLELQRTIHLPDWLKAMLKQSQPSGPRPAIGPPPDGSDPSFDPNFRVPSSIAVVLHRVER